MIMTSPLSPGLARGKKRPSLRALGQDTGAAVGPMIAVLGATLLASAGLALDIGLHQIGNRNLRAATEAAALSAAMDPTNAQTRATTYLTRNGYPASVLKTVAIGRYCPDTHTTWSNRFDPSGTQCPGPVNNAVRLTTQSPSRRFLTGILGNTVVPDLAATATAARIDEAGVEITSGLLTVSNSLVTSVNDLLGALIGVKLTLSTANIEALMSGNVDAGLFFDKLAQRTGQTGTYSELVQGTYGLADIANAAADAADSSKPATAPALRLFALQAGNGYKVPLKDLFGLGVWKNMPVGEADAQPSLHAGLNAYQLMAYAVQAGPGAIDASDLVKLILPSNPTAIVKVVAIASGPVDRPRFAFGPAGETKVGTSLLRLQLMIADLNVKAPGLLETTVNVPVLIDVAAAQAEVSSIACPSTAEQRTNTTVTVMTQSGLVNAYIGNPPANAMTKPLPPLSKASFTPTALIHLNLNILGLPLLVADVNALASVGPVFGQPATPLTFGPTAAGKIGSPPTALSPAVASVPVSLGNGSQVGPTLTALGTDLATPGHLTVEVKPALLGLCLGCDLIGKQNSILNTVLPAITTPVGQLLGTTADPLLDNVLRALGVQLGHATVWVNGARCGVPVLV
jgi:uncharacterized membrane protein